MVAVGIAGRDGRPSVVGNVEAAFVPAEGVHLLLGRWMDEQRMGDDPDLGRSWHWLTSGWLTLEGDS